MRGYLSCYKEECDRLAPEFSLEEQAAWDVFIATESQRQRVAGLDGEKRAERTYSGLHEAATLYGVAWNERLREMISLLELLELRYEAEYRKRRAEQEKASRSSHRR